MNANPRRLLAAVALSATVALAACGNDSTGGEPATTTRPTASSIVDHGPLATSPGDTTTTTAAPAVTEPQPEPPVIETTEPPATEPPATQPPRTSPPATKPPATQPPPPPATEAPPPPPPPPPPTAAPGLTLLGTHCFLAGEWAAGVSTTGAEPTSSPAPTEIDPLYGGVFVFIYPTSVSSATISAGGSSVLASNPGCP